MITQGPRANNGYSAGVGLFLTLAGAVGLWIVWQFRQDWSWLHILTMVVLFGILLFLGAVVLVSCVLQNLILDNIDNTTRELDASQGTRVVYGTTEFDQTGPIIYGTQPSTHVYIDGGYIITTDIWQNEISREPYDSDYDPLRRPEGD
jgi:hypothetical protein